MEADMHNHTQGEKSAERGAAPLPSAPDPLSSGNLPKAGVVLEATDADFDALVVKSPIPVLVDFWSPTCGPCRRLTPILNELAKDFAGQIAIVKVNIVDSPQTTIDHGIHAVPTLVFYKNGQIVDQMLGLHGKQKLSSEIAKVIQ